MSIKDKIKSVWEKARAAKKTHAVKRSPNGNANSELAADEVIEHEVFPDGKPGARIGKNKSAECAKDNVVKAKRVKAVNDNSAEKPASKRSRPTNNGYTMIDPDDNTCDTGKS